MLSEFSRIMDHCVCNGTTLVDVGALTNFWYMFQPREEIYGLLESVLRRPPDGLRLPHRRPAHRPAARLHGALRGSLLEIIPPFIDDVETLVDKNRIWHGPLGRRSPRSPARRRSTGAGPDPACAPAASAYDVRRAHPYDLYDTLDWEVPVLYGGDVYDRFQIRMLEMRAVAPDHPPAPRPRHARRARASSTTRTSRCRPKEACYNQMESMIYHFKLIMDGIQVPPGERYGMVEGGNGELGFYCISDGSASPTASRSARPASRSSRPSPTW